MFQFDAFASVTAGEAVTGSTRVRTEVTNYTVKLDLKF